MSTPQDTDPDFSDSDRAWFAALSGDSPAEPESPAARQGRALRVALEHQREQVEARLRDGGPASEAALARMRHKVLEQARRERLFRPPPANPSWIEKLRTLWHGAGTARKAGPRWQLATGLAFAVVLSALLVPVWRSREGPDYPQPTDWRGGQEGLHVRAVESPRAAAEAFAAALRAAGVMTGIYRRDRTYVVDVRLEAPQLAAARTAFDGVGLPLVEGVTRVEFTLK